MFWARIRYEGVLCNLFSWGGVRIDVLIVDD